MKVEKTVTKTICDVLQKECGTKELTVEDDVTVDISHKAAVLILQSMVDDGLFKSHIAPAMDKVLKDLNEEEK